ncbi:hypothetical protein LPJ55_000415 [Coemansia sp. RSA 990]|nr:hypothetical protein LPJ68_000762 [Coemansia sp. RSA 1086]KAJ1752865.1 hypothetical protein LPJ79_000852 [Coemansia sp. RSA 1821]KAJ1875789.1 hypothetical protein LPJ55_000415 [Coemansia sp. RSA 990]KAJ2650973.1 hypothetical protein IWW40_001992 [Coemansia sp. RSA 1250]
MPLCEITTNVRTADTKALSLKAASTVAELLSKPLAYVMAEVKHSPSLTFGGTDEAAVLVNIASLGAVGGDKNKAIVAGITALVGKELAVPPNRVYVWIHDIPRTDFGFNGSTFA